MTYVVELRTTRDPIPGVASRSARRRDPCPRRRRSLYVRAKHAVGERFGDKQSPSPDHCLSGTSAAPLGAEDVDEVAFLLGHRDASVHAGALCVVLTAEADDLTP
jgi:hypothetical protein